MISSFTAPRIKKDEQVSDACYPLQDLSSLATLTAEVATLGLSVHLVCHGPARDTFVLVCAMAPPTELIPPHSYRPTIRGVLVLSLIGCAADPDLYTVTRAPISNKFCHTSNTDKEF